jgi:Kef-type K+ transport system membrane component KefB/predicted amino acid-binding ACT domain protein
MDITRVLTDILVVLVAAKIAAELAERVGVPAVVAEIVAGVIVGPSALGLVGNNDDVLRTLGEIGVILLLLEVGMEMDLAELGKVGRASMLVATVGVICPLVLGLGAMQLIGDDFKTSLFVGAALTATSVGITARVFGDLRALATTEARIVLGAAVADDVMGLVVLTVVVRLVTEGSVSLLSVLGIVAVAVGFLVVSGAIGLRISGPLFSAVNRFSRSTGTLVAVALAFTLAYARLADTAKLAPIVGAFVAGIALTQSDQSDRIRRELAPVGHLFIPVFFLQIGIDADITSFGNVTVLRDALILLTVAVVGKLVSPIGAIGSPGDRLLIGLGMLPRGEVGLIFATIGLSSGVLDEHLYAALLLVVLATTLATPQLLKLRYVRINAALRATALAPETMPPGGWLRTGSGDVELAARPPETEGLDVALAAAVIVARAEPGPDLVNWLRGLPPTVLRWRRGVLPQLLDLIERGNARSWRFLDTTGVLAASLPELAQAFDNRRLRGDAIDQLQAYRLVGLEMLRRLDAGDPVAVEAQRLLHPDRLLLATLLAEVSEGEAHPAASVRATLQRLGLGTEAETEVFDLVNDRAMLWAASLRAGGFAEEAVVQIASHLDTPERARALFVLSSLLGSDRPSWEHARLRELHRLVQETLAHDELTGVEARNLLGQRRMQAIAMVPDNESVRERVARAPRPYVIREEPGAIARHAQLLTPAPHQKEARVRVAPGHSADTWWVDVGARDRHGLLARVTGVLASHDLDVIEAVIATWPDRVALEAFLVRSERRPDAGRLEIDLRAAFEVPLAGEALIDADVHFDDAASPWHTVCEVTAADKPGLLHTIATAFAAAGVNVVAASIVATDGIADDRFEVLDSDGHKLDASRQADVRKFLQGGVMSKRGWFGKTSYLSSTA